MHPLLPPPLPSREGARRSGQTAARERRALRAVGLRSRRSRSRSRRGRGGVAAGGRGAARRGRGHGGRTGAAQRSSARWGRGRVGRARRSAVGSARRAGGRGAVRSRRGGVAAGGGRARRGRVAVSAVSAGSQSGRGAGGARQTGRQAGTARWGCGRDRGGVAAGGQACARRPCSAVAARTTHDHARRARRASAASRDPRGRGLATHGQSKKKTREKDDDRRQVKSTLPQRGLMRRAHFERACDHTPVAHHPFLSPPVGVSGVNLRKQTHPDGS